MWLREFNTWYNDFASNESFPITLFHFNLKELSVIFIASNSCGRGGKISKKIEINLRYNVYEINTSI